jgi:hypothetical protein
VGQWTTVLVVVVPSFLQSRRLPVWWSLLVGQRRYCKRLPVFEYFGSHLDRMPLPPPVPNLQSMPGTVDTQGLRGKQPLL